MITDIYKNKRVTIFGLGFHKGGEGAARFFAEQGAIVTVTDKADQSKLEEAMQSLAGLPIRYVLGRHEERDFIETDLIVRNPGVPHTSEYLQIARDHTVPIAMESDIFFRLCPSRSIIAVTGTKGKSTTSHLSAHVLSSVGQQVHLMGNMGKSMLGELSDIRSEDTVVLELSSYQCEGFGGALEEFREHGWGASYAIVTNLYPDHLNRYASMEEYATAKKQLLLSQNNSQFSILNKENEWARFFAEGLESRVIWFDSTTLPADWNLRVLGAHNRLNAGAILCMTDQMGVAREDVRAAMESFVGVEHRLEFVRSLNGVDFYNDTTATNPDAAVAGLQTILELGKKVVLIAGGNDKGMNFETFVKRINDNRIHTVLLAGSADEKLAGISEELVVGKYTDFEEAITTAYTTAGSDAIVLLSPGATSFNLFRDEFDRGRQFKEIVRSL